MGGLYRCFLCLRQVDLKAFVAYSSVCHMGCGLGGLIRGTAVGLGGRVFMMIGHGFCSSCLFYILFVFYDRFYSRRMLILKGINFYVPLLGGVWFLFLVLNMGVPPSLSFFSEVMILCGRFSFWFFNCFVFFGLLLFSGFYGIVLFVCCSHGNGVIEGMQLGLRVREVLNFFIHFFFCVYIILGLDFFFLWLFSYIPGNN